MNLTGENVSTKREIVFQTGNQFFLNEKNEIISRKAPNLVMSYYDCVRQLRYIHQRVEDLKQVEAFYAGALADWENTTQVPIDKPV
jgi:hypothetical protein